VAADSLALTYFAQIGDAGRGGEGGGGGGGGFVGRPLVEDSCVGVRSEAVGVSVVKKMVVKPLVGSGEVTHGDPVGFQSDAGLTTRL
jgi:hypothetical protein